MKILCVLLIIIMARSGSIATNNCPSTFLMSTANVTSPANIQFNFQTAVIVGNVGSSNHYNKLKNIIIQGDQNQLYKYLVSLTNPFIAVTVIFFLVFFLVISCYLCEKSCPPCQSWKRDLKRYPYKKSQLLVPTILSLIFSVVAIIVVFILLTNLSTFQNQVTNTKCGIFTALDSAINGDRTNNWGGISYMSKQIGIISSNLNKLSSAIALYFPDNSWINNQRITLQNLISNLQNTYQNSTLLNPNPNSNTNITPIFIDQNFGIHRTNNNLVTDLSNGLNITQVLSNLTYEIDLSAKVLNDQLSTGSIQSNLNLSTALLTQFNTRLSNFQSNMNDFSTSYFDQIFAYLKYAIYIALGFILSASIISIMGISTTYFCNIYKCRSMVHFSWVVFGIIYFVVIGLTYIFLPGGIVATDFCTFYNSVLTDRAAFKSLNSYDSQNVLSKIEACIFDNGAILSKFNSDTEINSLINLFTQLSTLNTMINSSSSQFVDTSQESTRITNWISTLEKLRDGYVIDSNATDDDNPFVIINSFSNITQSGTVVNQKCSGDIWVYQYQNCTYGTKAYTSGSPVHYLNNVCLSFNGSMIQGGSIWTLSDFNKRYIPIQKDCPQTYTKIMKYGNSIILYRDSRINLYQSLINDLNNILGNYTDFVNKLQYFEVSASSFQTNVSVLQKLMLDKLTGMNSSMNCSIIGDNLRFVYNAFCVNFMNQIYKFGIVFLVLCLVLFIGVITGSIFAIRYGNIQKQQVVVIPVLSESQIKKDQDESEQGSERNK